MSTNPCPDCGHSTEATVCPNCGHALANGALAAKPPPPPEVASWVIEKMTPEIAALLGTFNKEEFLAEFRQAEKAGFPELKDLIRELEQEMNSSD